MQRMSEQKPGWEPLGLVPHRAPMLLLDGVQEVTEEKCLARVRVDPSAWYAGPDGSMPGWFGIELMAQTIAAYSGARKREAGQAPKLGFLLGTRSLECSLPSFPPGALLDVEAQICYLDESGLSAFQCEIRHLGQTVSKATLKTYEEP